MSTTSLTYVVQAIINQEYGDLRSILDEAYPNPNDGELKVLFNLLYVVKGATYTYDRGTGWESSTRRRAFPIVVPNPRSKGCAVNCP